MLDIVATFLVLTALLAYINQRFIGLPATIGVMGIALALSLIFVGLEQLGLPGLSAWVEQIVRPIDFSQLLMQGMLSLLLFAGALHVDLDELRAHRVPVLVLAFLGTVVSTVLIAVGLSLVLPWLGAPLPFAYCLAFGALISPTDPIAVLGIMRNVGAPKSVEVVITGESLFNDGVGVVLFSLATALIEGTHRPTPLQVALTFFEQTAGGLVYGVLLGTLITALLRTIDSYQEEVLLTLAAVVGGYALAEHLGVSGPLAMVVVGLVVGHFGRRLGMSPRTRTRLDMFWELLDALLNSVLFVLMGFEIILLKFRAAMLLPTLVALELVLLARLVTVALPVSAFERWFRLPQGSWRVLTWGGLRGGISVALALSLPRGAGHDMVVTLTYAVVVFSILVQGLTIGPLVRGTLPCTEPHTEAHV